MSERLPAAITGSPVDTDIATLTRRMLERDDAAYQTFHDAYYGRLFRYLLVVSGREATARDALQETYRRVVRHIRVFENESVFWSWLTVLARSALFDEQRKHRRYFSFLDRFTRELPEHGSVDQTSERDQMLHDSLDKHLALLSGEDRDLVEWKYFDRIPVRAIAERLGTSEGAIESRLVRIRRKLKSALLDDLKNDSST